MLWSRRALDFECEVGSLIDNLAIATGTEMLSVAWLTLNQLVAVRIRAVPICGCANHGVARPESSKGVVAPPHHHALRRKLRGVPPMKITNVPMV